VLQARKRLMKSSTNIFFLVGASQPDGIGVGAEGLSNSGFSGIMGMDLSADQEQDWCPA